MESIRLRPILSIMMQCNVFHTMQCLRRDVSDERGDAAGRTDGARRSNDENLTSFKWGQRPHGDLCRNIHACTPRSGALPHLCVATPDISRPSAHITTHSNLAWLHLQPCSTSSLNPASILQHNLTWYFNCAAIQSRYYHTCCLDMLQSNRALNLPRAKIRLTIRHTLPSPPHPRARIRRTCDMIIKSQHQNLSRSLLHRWRIVTKGLKPFQFAPFHPICSLHWAIR